MKSANVFAESIDHTPVSNPCGSPNSDQQASSSLTGSVMHGSSPLATRHSAPTAAPRIPEGPPIDAHALHGAGQIRS